METTRRQCLPTKQIRVGVRWLGGWQCKLISQADPAYDVWIADWLAIRLIALVGPNRMGEFNLLDSSVHWLNWGTLEEFLFGRAFTPPQGLSSDLHKNANLSEHCTCSVILNKHIPETMMRWYNTDAVDKGPRREITTLQVVIRDIPFVNYTQSNWTRRRGLCEFNIDSLVG